MSKHEMVTSTPAVSHKTQPTSPTRQKTVLVLGGYGFVGRHTVRALQRHNVRVLIGTRGKGKSIANDTERFISLHKALRAADWHTVLEGVDAVINTVGILRERRGEGYDAVHNRGPEALAKACRKRNITLIHMSALGIEDSSPNRYTLSKLNGENALTQSGCTGSIVRTSVVNAVDGYGSGWLYRVACWPVWMVPAGAVHLLSPIEADDVGEALAQLAIQPHAARMQLVELGCGESFTLLDYLTKLRQSVDPSLPAPLFTIRVPQTIARFFAHLFDWLHITPYSIGHHELLEADNVPFDNQLQRILGRAPTRIGGSAITAHNLTAVQAKRKLERIAQ